MTELCYNGQVNLCSVVFCLKVMAVKMEMLFMYCISSQLFRVIETMTDGSKPDLMPVMLLMYVYVFILVYCMLTCHCVLFGKVCGVLGVKEGLTTDPFQTESKNLSL